MASHLRQILNCSPLTATLGGNGSSNLKRSISSNNRVCSARARGDYWGVLPPLLNTAVQQVLSPQDHLEAQSNVHPMVTDGVPVPSSRCGDRARARMKEKRRDTQPLIWLLWVAFCASPCLAVNPLSGVMRAYASVLASNPTATHLVQGAAVTGLGDAASQWIEGAGFLPTPG